MNLLRFLFSSLISVNAAVINGWLFTPQGLLGTGTLTCGQNVSFLFAVSNATNLTAGLSIQSTGGGGVTTVGTPLVRVPFLLDTNTTTNYSCPSSFNPGFGGTRYVGLIIVDTTTFRTPQFSIVAAPSPSRTPTPTPSSTLSATPSVTASQSPTSSQTSSSTPTSSVTPTASMTPTPRTIIDINAIKTEAQGTTISVVGGAVGGLLGLVCIGAGVKRILEKKRMRERRMRATCVSQRRATYDPVMFNPAARRV